jgi:hypothetical protein
VRFGIQLSFNEIVIPHSGQPADYIARLVVGQRIIGEENKGRKMREWAVRHTSSGVNLRIYRRVEEGSRIQTARQ